MAGLGKPHKPGGNYRGWYNDMNGKRKFFTGTSNEKETLSMALRLEDDHKQVRLGYRPVPNSAQKHRSRSFAEVAEEYQAWGEAQGGRKGHPWSAQHARQRQSILRWWESRLGLETLGDLDSVLARVEKALRELLNAGRAGKTVTNYQEAIGAICDWCVDRGYLADDPLKGMVGFDTTPQTKRRVMSVDEIRALVHVSRTENRLLYETALFSGLRANELRSLTIDHLDVERCGFHLEAAWTKNRQPGFQPIPRDLVQRLKAFAETGEAERIYEKTFKKANAKQHPPKRPLLYVPTQTDRRLKLDLDAAGIPHITPKGKLDFHALRTTSINLIMDTGLPLRDAQSFARHATPQMTMGTYGRPREDRVAEAVEEVAKVLNIEEVCATYVQRLAVGAERENATFSNSEGCVSQKLVAGTGFEPATFGL